MKKHIISIAILIFAFAFHSNAQKGVDTLKIKTSAQCSMCTETIEKAMAYERGVESSSLDLDTKILTVIYKEKKTSPGKIRKAISKVGYDADDVAANERAYSKLPACCKKPDDPDYEEM
ncbi:MAG: heavy-metal-associated domain-containing protein [Bacteroidales bacterium]